MLLNKILEMRILKMCLGTLGGGRTAIGVDPKLDTSSDMFVRTNDGKNIGISLKQDGSVFLNNWLG